MCGQSMTDGNTVTCVDCGNVYNGTYADDCPLCAMADAMDRLTETIDDTQELVHRLSEQGDVQ